MSWPRFKLPPGIVEDSPPDEESTRSFRELGARPTTKLSWDWVRKRFGSTQDDDYYKSRRLYIEVRPFDDRGQWLQELAQEFTADDLRAARAYGVELMQSEPRVQGFWLDAYLFQYWNDLGERKTLPVFHLGQYERAPLNQNRGGYYVWLLRRGSDEPLTTEGPYGPHTLKVATDLARIGAQNGKHDRVVTYGSDPDAPGFKISKRYSAGG